MVKFYRWLAIKLLARFAHRRIDENDQRRVYKITRGLSLVGQAPGAAYTVDGRMALVLLGEGLHFLPSRTVLRTPGAMFSANGVIQCFHGYGRSWLWFLQVG